MAVFADAYMQTYAEKKQAASASKRRHTPVLVILAKVLATIAVFGVKWATKLRRNILYLAGFSLINFAIFSWNDLVGYAAIGVTLLILEALSGGDEK